MREWKCRLCCVQSVVSATLFLRWQYSACDDLVGDVRGGLSSVRQDNEMDFWELVASQTIPHGVMLIVNSRRCQSLLP
jgi:hypothetical protein